MRQLLIVGAGSIVLFAYLFAWALCQSASDGDEAIRQAEEMEPVDGVFVPTVRR